ncbi:hypothetical protein H5410_033219 [Solanum commersonii]|uniref:Uncharacterized protein n=1 Tax=Solanum commersonii TaxID=4109 RepID=A0A9J5YN52_SOLCO|nr:hypothetical protein H5410_033219 [Solanum commersonii]
METQDFFSTLKETEHAAAKVENCLTSCTSIPLNGGSWRRGFQGQEAKTNKQAEMNATNRLTQG